MHQDKSHDTIGSDLVPELFAVIEKPVLPQPLWVVLVMAGSVLGIATLAFC